MSRSHTKWSDRLSAYLDGDIDASERAELEEHLGSCGDCRSVLEGLAAVRAAAGELDDLEPSRDLWQGIEAVISAPPVVEADVIALPTAGSMPRPERFVFTAPQLVAASIALIAFSAATTWWAGPGVAATPAAPIATIEEPVPAVSFAGVDHAPPEGLAEELAELEGVLNTAREVLDPNTVRVLERNLAVIEQAIADSQRALEVDPGNEYLQGHLSRIYERKVAFLRDANRVIEWAG